MTTATAIPPGTGPAFWAYIAGLYEGSGWITLQRKLGRRTRYVNIGFGRQDCEALNEIAERLGGRVNGPYDRAGGGKVPEGAYNQRYVLMLTRRSDIDAFLGQVYSMLSPGKQEAIMINMAEDTRGPWSPNDDSSD